MYGCYCFGDRTFGDVFTKITYPDRAELSEAAAIDATVSLLEGIGFSEGISVSKRVVTGPVCIGDFCYGGAQDTARIGDSLTMSDAISVQESGPGDGAGLSENLFIFVSQDQKKAADSAHLAQSLFAQGSIPAQDGAALSDKLTLSVIGQPLATVRDASRLKPVYLVRITLKNGGPTLCFSDRNITVGGQVYESYLHDLSGIAQELKRADSTALDVNVELSFRNDKISYSGTDYGRLIELQDAYPFETSVCEIRETALDQAGFPAQPAIVFKGVLDCPQKIDLLGFKCKVSAMPCYMDALWRQTQLETDNFPAATDDAGKYIPVVYGSGILMPALRVDWTKTTLVNDILPTDTATLELTNPQGFPASGQIIIDEEIISYAGLSGRTLTGVARQGFPGVVGGSFPHAAGSEVIPYRATYDFVLATHPLQAVGDIFAEIAGKLWLVTGGVEYVWDGTFARLRMGRAICVTTALDDISVVDTTAIGDGIDVSNTLSANDQIALYDAGHSHPLSASSVSFLDQTTTGLPVGGDYIGASRAAAQVYFAEWEVTPTRIVWEADVNFTVWDANTKLIPFGQIILQIQVGNGGSYSEYSITAPHNPGTVHLQFTMYSNAASWTANYATIVVAGPPSAYQVSMRVTGARRTLYGGLTVIPQQAGITKQGSVYLQGDVLKTGTVWLNGNVAKTGTVLSFAVVERLHAVVSGYADDAYGTYTGTPGAVIERPDAVIRHFLTVASGIFAEEDIDAPPFSAAASFYGANGYKQAFCLDKLIKPSQWLSRLAFECRSTLAYTAGLWHLNVIPVAAPAPVRTLTKDDLAGKLSAFTFGKTDWTKIGNHIVASYDRQYTTIPGKSQSGWLGTVTVQDAASQGVYGVFKKDIQFESIRMANMARSVLGHMLLEAKTPNLTVEFPVFWENFDLNVGDTIAIQNGIFNGTVFFIEQITRKDAFRATVKAVGWWG